MHTEIEAKLKVPSIKEVQRKLSACGARFVAEQRHKDSYFDDSDMVLTSTDRCMRIRRQLVGGREDVILTYKGPKEKDKFKRRRELELEVKDSVSAEEFFSVLGYEKVLSFEKKRQVYHLGDCEIALDEVPLLGDFVEIEGPSAEKIVNVQKVLGLSDVPHITQSYADMIREKLCQLGKMHARGKEAKREKPATHKKNISRSKSRGKRK